MRRYGLVVSISGSHPEGPGSIPGKGICFCTCTKQKQTCFSTYVQIRVPIVCEAHRIGRSVSVYIAHNRLNISPFH